MTRRGIATVVLAATLGLAPLGAAAAETVRTTFVDGAGRKIGTAVLTQTPSGVLVEVDLAGLAPGWKAFHIHETGRCDPGSGFKSAGEHFAPRQEHHGLRADKGPHGGDMPNLKADAEGKATIDAPVSNNVNIGKGDGFDILNHAVIVHADPADYKTQPTGNAGARLACGVIQRHPT